MVSKTLELTSEGLEVKSLTKEEVIARVMTSIRERLPLRIKDIEAQIKEGAGCEVVMRELIYDSKRLMRERVLLCEGKELIKYELELDTLKCDNNKYYEVQLRNVMVIKMINEKLIVSFDLDKVRTVDPEEIEITRSWYSQLGGRG
jgi:hypothetical protein